MHGRFSHFCWKLMKVFGEILTGTKWQLCVMQDGWMTTSPIMHIWKMFQVQDFVFVWWIRWKLKVALFSVVFIANYPKKQLLNSTFQKFWIEKQIRFALKHNLGIKDYLSLNLNLRYVFLDGVNFDFEDELESGSEESHAYTRLFKTTVAQFHHRIAHSQVSIDVAWSPENVYRRGYEYAALAGFADLGI